ncbi:uncharacterized protein LOC122883029 isoform X3 [Siniperca chuatsi]|uniref:uncharacterized protein LOC122883029 isoform X3 n=1 Tax=Siniperca chuatsi TaxID=119488 RepID=UPI001CE11DE2|nr:uncharacterized protein LOC122883029 isoform X3 [Siniperca chuatsi]
MRGTVGGFAIGIHCKCCESNLTTPAVLHKGATYKLFKTTSQAYRRKQLCAKQKKEIVSIKWPPTSLSLCGAVGQPARPAAGTLSPVLDLEHGCSRLSGIQAP